MSAHPPLLPNRFYHLISRGVNRDPIFLTDADYLNFLEKYIYHVAPVVDTFAYCLMGNHFHFLVRIKETAEIKDQIREVTPALASKAISNCLNAYAKTFNRQNDRTGSLFQRPFKRIPILDDSYLLTVIPYIHLNPQKHGFVEDFQEWPWSSYWNLLSGAPSTLNSSECLDWFQTSDNFKKSHLVEEIDLESFKLVDWG